MASEKRPYFCGILVLATLALFFHLAGFVTPGWLIMRLSFEQESSQTSVFHLRLQPIDVMDPSEVKEQSEGVLEKLRNRRSSQPEELDITDELVVEENNVLETWITQTTIEIETFEVSTHYGLWYSTFCVHEKNKGDHDSAEKHKHDSSSSSSEEDDHKKGHCHCRKISTKCALYNSFIYEDPMDYINPGPHADRVLSTKNFGYASLKEQQIENCIVLAFLVIGFISAIGGFRKVTGCRCAAVTCVIFMLLAALVAIVPVSRFTHYSVNKHHQTIPVTVHAPYSAISCGLGAIFSLITALVASYAILKRSRKQEPGKWYQFNNELELPHEAEKKPVLVFISDTLPDKSGLNDDLQVLNAGNEVVA